VRQGASLGPRVSTRNLSTGFLSIAISPVLGNHIVESAEGVQQGDPLGPLLFTLAIHHLLSHLKADLKVFYMDDDSLTFSINSVKFFFKLL
jgi:hypothetical protein